MGDITRRTNDLPMLLSMKTLNGYHRSLELAEPVNAVLSFDQGTFWVINSAMQITGAGGDREEALQMFIDLFVDRFVTYVGMIDSGIAADDRAIRDKFRSLVPTWKEQLARIGP